MLSCTHCRHAAVSRIPQKRKFCKMNQSDCRNHKFPGFHDFMLDAIRGISSWINFNWKTEQTKYYATTFRILIQNDSDKHTNITQNIRIFRSLVQVLNKLPDHNNLPFFNDMLQFWYQSWVSLFVLWDFSCQSKQFPSMWNWFNLSSSAFLIMIMQNEYYITQTFVSLSLVTVLNKLPDHHNLPLFDDVV